VTWTKEQIEKIPEVYLDFMMALKPIIDTRRSVVAVSAVPLGSVYNSLLTRYPYSPQEVRQIADNLKKAELIREDSLTFLTPTVKGEALINELAGSEDSPNGVPPFPDLP